GFTKREFNFSSFKRSFRLPEIADAEGVNAKYDNGILSVSIPKLEIEENPRRREIAIS
ncbi:MAG: Hsp20 family protein, partial [Bacteroidota bacterium]